MPQQAPDRLPADFFDKQDAPDRLPANFFDAKPEYRGMAELKDTGRLPDVKTGAYKYGGKPGSKEGTDCSGGMCVIGASLGVTLPRTAKAQFEDKRAKSVDPKNLQPGDLVFFNSPGPSGWHVGMYKGNGKFVHQSSDKKPDLSEGDLASHIKKYGFKGAKRYEDLAAKILGGTHVGNQPIVKPQEAPKPTTLKEVIEAAKPKPVVQRGMGELRAISEPVPQAGVGAEVADPEGTLAQKQQYWKQFAPPGRETGLENVQLPPSSKMAQPTNTAGPIEKTWARQPEEKDAQYAQRISHNILNNLATGFRSLHPAAVIASMSGGNDDQMKAVHDAIVQTDPTGETIRQGMAGLVMQATDIPLDLQVMFGPDATPEERAKALVNTAINVGAVNPLKFAGLAWKTVSRGIMLGKDVAQASAAFEKALDALHYTPEQKAAFGKELTRLTESSSKGEMPKFDLSAPAKPAETPKAVTPPKTPEAPSPASTKGVAPKTPKPKAPAVAKAESELEALRQAMIQADAKPTIRRPRSKKSGAVEIPGLTPERAAYFAKWVEVKGLQGREAVREFLNHVINDLKQKPGQWKAALDAWADSIDPTNAKNFTEANRPNKTGLANRVQDAEAIGGIINEVEKTKGTSRNVWQEKGKQAVDGGLDFHDLANKVGDGSEELTGLKAGALLEGKRRLQLDLNQAQARLDDAIRRKEGVAAAKADVAAKQAIIDDYLQKVQSGKGRWSDVGRALQAGTELDTGNYAEVLEAFERAAGRRATTRESEAIAADVKKITDEVRKAVPDYDPAKETVQQALDRTVAQNVKRTKAQGMARRIAAEMKSGAARDKTVVLKERADEFAHLKAILSPAKFADRMGAVGGAFQGAIEITSEALASIKKIIALSIEASKLDDVEAFVPAELKRILKDATGKTASDSDVEEILARMYDDTSRTPKDVQAEAVKTRKASQKVAEAEREPTVKKIKSAVESLDGNDARQRAAKTRLENILKRLQEQKEGKFRDIKAKRESPSPQFDDLREEIKSIRKSLALEDRLYTLEDRLRKGEFKGPDRKTTILTREQEDQALRVRLMERAVRRRLAEADIHVLAKHLGGAAQNIRGLLLGSDLGIVLRQGLFSLSRPATMLEGIKKMAWTMFSEENFVRHLDELNFRRVNGQLAANARRKAGLQLSAELIHDEELVAANILKRIPFIGPKIAGSLERAQISFINQVRADLFDSMLKKAGITEKDLAARAQFINAATGRSNAKQINHAWQVVLTSPRYERSRWELIGQAIKNPLMLRNAGARANFQDMIVTAAELYGLMRVAELTLGYKLDIDPKSTDFLKMRKGDEVWDVTAGMAPRLRDLYRIVFLIDKTTKDPSTTKKNLEDVAKIALKGIIRPISPGVKVPVTQAFYKAQRDKGVPESQLRDFFSGYVADEDDKGLQSIAPLVYQSFMKALKEEESVGAGLWAAGREFAGTSVSRYPKSNIPFGTDYRPKKSDAEKNIDKLMGGAKTKAPDPDALIRKLTAPK